MSGWAFGSVPTLVVGRWRGSDRRARRVVALGTAAGLVSGLSIQRRRAHAAQMPATSRAPEPAPASAFANAMAGAFAGGISRVAVAPLDVVKIRMQVQVEPVAASAAAALAGSSAGAAPAAGKYRGIAQCVSTIMREEGAKALWAGTVPALFLWVPYTAVQFATLGEFKRVCAANRVDGSKPAVAFAGGALAGAAATVCTYPFDVLRTTLAAQGSPRVYDSLAAAATGIVNARGVRGLYAGVGVTLAEIIPASAIQFGSYAALKAIADRAEGGWGGVAVSSRGAIARRRSPGKTRNEDAADDHHDHSGSSDHDHHGSSSAWSASACGFGAGCVARLVIHPLDVVKKRFQVAGLARDLRYGERVAAREFSTFAGAVRAIARKEGVAGFYKGLAPGLIKSAPASAITFAAYEFATAAIARAREE